MAMVTAMAMEVAWTRSLNASMSDAAQTNLTASPGSTFWRVAVGVASLVVACAAFANSVAHITREGNPQAALSFWPNDAEALARSADIYLPKLTTGRDANAQIKRLATQSLRAQAVNPRALRLLGFVADANGAQPAARALVTLAAQSSRRDFGAQLWLIENAVRGGSIADTLRHYDIAIRATAESAATLYPILTEALEDPEIQRGFSAYVKTPPPWLGSFLAFAISQSKVPRTIATLIIGAGGLPKGPAYHDLDAAMIARLAAVGDYPMVKSYYLSLPGVDPNLLTSTALEKISVDPDKAPLTWQIVNSPALDAGFETNDNDQSLNLHAIVNSGETGVVMRKVFYLTHGNYRFAADQQLSNRDGSAQIKWDLKCVRGTDATSVWISDSGITKARTPSMFAIPENCPTQLLELTVRGGTAQQGTDLVVNNIRIDRQ